MNGSAVWLAGRASRDCPARRSPPVSDCVSRSSASPGTVATKNENIAIMASTPVVTMNDIGLLIVVRQNAEKNDVSARSRNTPISTSMAISSTRQIRCAHVTVTSW